MALSATQKAGYSTKSAPSTTKQKTPTSSLPKASGSGSSALSSALSKATSNAPSKTPTAPTKPATTPTKQTTTLGVGGARPGETRPQATVLSGGAYTPKSPTTLAVGGSRPGVPNTSVSAPAKASSGGGGYSTSKYTPGAPVQGAQQAPAQTGSTMPEWLATAPDMATVNQGSGESQWGTSDPSFGSSDIGSSFNNVMNTYAQSSAQDQANMAVMMEGMLQYIDQMGSQLTSQIRSQMGMDDPETANAIAMIKKQAEDTYKVMLEDLNAKGLVQSGIYAQARADLANSQGMHVSNFVAQRFGDLQSQLNNALMSIGQMRIGAMSQNMSMVNSNNMQNNATMANLGMQGINAQLTARGQDMSQNQWQQSFDWNKQTDTRNFDYKQTQDAIQNQYTQQGLDIQKTSANNAGAGNSLGWAQLGWQQSQTEQQNKAYAYDYGTQNVAALGATIKDMNSYNYAVQQIANNPMYADTGVKQALLAQLEQYKPATPVKPTNAGNAYTPTGWSNGFNSRMNPWK